MTDQSKTIPYRREVGRGEVVYSRRENDRSWRGTSGAPLDGVVEAIVLGYVAPIYVSYDGNNWRDANGSPVCVLAWRSYADEF